jgi:hypothetical protein
VLIKRRSRASSVVSGKRRWLLAAICLGLIVGCSRNGKLNVTGKVLKGGAPLTVPDDEYVRVTFFPVTTNGSPPKNTYAASYNNNNGTFRATGADGQGIPPGKYRVAVEHEKNRRDLFKGVYDGDRSPFQFNIRRIPSRW